MNSVHSFLIPSQPDIISIALCLRVSIYIKYNIKLYPPSLPLPKLCSKPLSIPPLPPIYMKLPNSSWNFYSLLFLISTFFISTKYTIFLHQGLYTVQIWIFRIWCARVANFWQFSYCHCCSFKSMQWRWLSILRFSLDSLSKF